MQDRSRGSAATRLAASGLHRMRRRTARLLPAAAALAAAGAAALSAASPAAAAEAGPIAYEESPAIHLIDPATGADHVAVTHGSNPALFPGSRRLAYIRGVGVAGGYTLYSIYVKSLRTDHPQAPGRRLLRPRAFFVRDLSVTPDGRRVVFAARRGFGPGRRHGRDMEIYSISTSGRDLRRLTRNHRFSNDVDVSPDGRRVAFVEKVRGRAQVFVMDSDGRHQRRVTYDGRRNRSPHWSSDGRRLVYFSARRSSPGCAPCAIFTVPAAGRPRRRFAPRRLHGMYPDYSPDGRRLAFVREGALWQMRARGGGARLLRRTERAEIAAVDWGSR